MQPCNRKPVNLGYLLDLEGNVKEVVTLPPIRRKQRPDLYFERDLDEYGRDNVTKKKWEENSNAGQVCKKNSREW